MKVKLFESEYPLLLENNINFWLAENENIVVMYVYQFVVRESFIETYIWYEE